MLFSIPASKLRYAAFANDTNSQKRSIVLRPFNESDFVESDLELKQNTTGLLINELVEALSGSDLLGIMPVIMSQLICLFEIKIF